MTTIITNHAHTVDWVATVTMAHNELTAAGLYRVKWLEDVIGE